MKKKTAALLLNAFVLPGTGQWVSGRKTLAVVFILVTLAAIAVLFSYLLQQAQLIISSIEPGTVPDAAAIEATLRSSLQSDKSRMVSIAVTALVVTWVSALLDVVIRKPATETDEQT